MTGRQSRPPKGGGRVKAAPLRNLHIERAVMRAASARDHDGKVANVLACIAAADHQATAEEIEASAALLATKPADPQSRLF